MTNFPLK